MTEILLYIAIAVLVVWRVIIRQFRGSTLTVRGLVLMPGILVVLGAINCAKALPTASGKEIALLGVDLAVLIVFGVARAASMTISERAGHAFQKGGTLTLVLWFATIAVRIGFAAAGTWLGATGPLTSASLLLSMGLSIGVQNALVFTRARRLGIPVAADRSAVAVRR